MVSEDDARGAIPADTWIERFVDMVEARTDAPLGFAVGTAYALASLLVPPDMYIQFGGQVHAHQYVCLIGESGDTRKTVVVSYGRKVINAWDPAVSIHEPESERSLAIDLEAEPQALLSIGEMGAFLDGTQKRSYKSSLRSRLTMLWDGDPWHRKTKDQPLAIDEPRLSFIGGVAPSFLEETMTTHDFDGGFLNRFLIIHAERERNYPIPPMIPPVDVHTEFAELRADAQLNWSPCIGWTDEGREYWSEWEEYCQSTWGDNPRMRGFLARAAPLALKAAMALAIVKGVATTGKGWELGVEVLEEACWLGMLHLQSVASIIGNLSMGTFARLRREVLLIIRYGKRVTMAQILARLAANGEARKKRDLTEVLETLVAEKTVEGIARAGKGTIYQMYAEEVEL